MNMLNPYTWLIGALILAFVGGTAYVGGRMDGKKVERAEWQAKELQAQQDLAEALATAQTKVSEQQKRHALAVNIISTEYEERLRNVSKTKDRVISDLRSGATRLRDPGSRYSLGGNSMPGAGTSAGECDGKTGAGLSGELAEFLTSEASRADAVVDQLTACQAVILARPQVVLSAP